jgi:hypothetical protein
MAQYSTEFSFSCAGIIMTNFILKKVISFFDFDTTISIRLFLGFFVERNGTLHKTW